MRGRARALGQHFLVDRRVAAKIVDAAGLSSADTVVEIGPGRGVLTRLLIQQAGRVLAIEVDQDLHNALARELGHHPRVTLIRGDALQYPYEAVPGVFKVVSNLPYAIAIPLLFRLLAVSGRVVFMVLMFQQEVAERLLASPGGKDFGPLSLAVQAVAGVERLASVSAHAFRPRPAVTSTVVRVTPRPVSLVRPEDQGAFQRVVRTAFQRRRKTLANAMLGCGLPKETILRLLSRTGIDPRRRPETLALEEWVRLSILVRAAASETVDGERGID